MIDSPRVHFVLDPGATHWPDIERLDAASIEREPRRFVGGRNSWIAQTYVRLREALNARGILATCGPGFVAGAICVAHRDDLDRVTMDAHASFLIAVRADRAPVEACDFAIAQNAIALRAHERYVPLWPQPGLRPRHEERGARLQTIAYMGRTSSAPVWLRDRTLHAALARCGVTLQVREREWHDYRHVDAALAVREEAAAVLATKPATKLYNGWLAGVPVLATPEPAYRELRSGPLDFLEVSDTASIVRAVERLRDDPALYLSMRTQGLLRGREFSVASIAARWLDLFDREILPAFAAWSERRALRRSWFVAAMLWQKAESRAHRSAVAFQRWAGPRGGAFSDARNDLSAGGRLSPGGD